MKLDLVVIIPVYNESEIIVHVLKDWLERLESLSLNFLIAVYNDGSNDETKTILMDFAINNNHLKIINKKNSGHGPTILQGYNDFAEKAQWIFQVDSDNEIDSASFKNFWDKRNDFDFLIGTRKKDNIPLTRKIISKIARIISLFLFDSPLTDVNCPYRLMSQKFLRECLPHIPQGTNIPNIFLSCLAAKLDFKFKEIKVSYCYRSTGKPSLNKWKLLKFSIVSSYQLCLLKLKS